VTAARSEAGVGACAYTLRPSVARAHTNVPIATHCLTVAFIFVFISIVLFKNIRILSNEFNLFS